MLVPVKINLATKSDATPLSLSNELFLLVFITNVKWKKKHVI